MKVRNRKIIACSVAIFIAVFAMTGLILQKKYDPYFFKRLTMLRPEEVFLENMVNDVINKEIILVSDEPDGQATVSLAEAMKRIHPNVTIQILPGLYRVSFYVDSVGNPDYPIIIEGAVKDGQRPIFDGKREMNSAFIFSHTKNVVFRNLEFQNYTDHGLYVNYSSDVIIENNIFHDNGFAAVDPDFDGEGFGLLVSDSERVIIKNNEAYKNGPSLERFKQGLSGTAIDTFKMNDSEIINNYTYENVGAGILVEDGHDVLVKGNRIENNSLDLSFDGWWDGGIWIDGGYNISIIENVIKDNSGPALEISNEEDANVYGYYIDDNFIDNNYYGLYIWNFGQCPPKEEHVKIGNNKITNSSRKDILCGEEFILE